QPAPLWIPHAPVIPHGRRAVSPYDSTSSTSVRNVDLQVLPLSCAENSGLGGSFRLLRLKEGTTIALNEIQLLSRVISNPREVQLLDIRYGVLRAQALTPRDSLAFIEKLLGET
ncbi:Scr1 family TA system antitoxin-like transcriptional regulator, partial [Streptomyces sp. NPDC096310]|uniref:Scr1 family TA system antitoxin-like transcriptional regulator n=1 Tax=Streptomyces sp. NPDC096310 TaxID=3366082 RepID=UPI00382CE4F1